MQDPARSQSYYLCHLENRISGDDRSISCHRFSNASESLWNRSELWYKLLNFLSHLRHQKKWVRFWDANCYQGPLCRRHALSIPPTTCAWVMSSFWFHLYLFNTSSVAIILWGRVSHPDAWKQLLLEMKSSEDLTKSDVCISSFPRDPELLLLVE